MKDNKQVQQMIALGVLVTLCVGVFAFQMLRGKHSAPPSSKVVVGKPDTSKSVAPPVGAGPAEGVEAVAVAEVKDDGLMMAPTGHDPFAPAMDTSIRIGSSTPSPFKIASSRTGGRVPKMDSFFEFKGDNNAAIEPLPPVNPNASGGQGQMSQPTPQFVLTGVITGDVNVAIIRLNDERHIVRIGQTIDGEYRVVNITGNSVKLAWEGHNDIVLVLGG